VIGGMLAATFVATMLIPLFFSLTTFGRRKAEPDTEDGRSATEAEARS
jgi:hypothetical protein